MKSPTTRTALLPGEMQAHRQDSLTMLMHRVASSFCRKPAAAAAAPERTPKQIAEDLAKLELVRKRRYVVAWVALLDADGSRLQGGRCLQAHRRGGL